MGKNSNVLAKSLAAIGVTSVLFLTGCASGTATVAETTPSPVESATATATATASAAPTIVAVDAAGNPVDPSDVIMPGTDDPFSYRLYADSQSVKAGGSIHVTGGTYAPGVTVVVYGAQIMPMPSYDAANDMYYQVGEQVILTDKISVVTNDKGQFDMQLPIPAGTAPQQIDLISEATDGRSDLIRTNID